MEGHQPDQALQIAMMPGGSGALGASRWNPTKEQIDMLEDVYKQGIRTPNAEQINDITSRLREYGHIEGKNVFYWFQNHKARQRQKQKQSKKDTISYSNRFILPKPPVSSATYHQPPHFPAGVCMPYRAEMGLYNQQQQPRLLLPRPVKRRPPPLFPAPVAGGPPGRFLPPYSGQANYYYNNGLIFSPGRGIEENKETLELFPVQPSGDLLSPNYSSSNFLSGGKRQIQGIPAAGDGGGDRAFFDFMCGSNIASSSRDRY